ncbi:hypothetical protein HK100_005200, partial [Physocladia obscura]
MDSDYDHEEYDEPTGFGLALPAGGRRASGSASGSAPSNQAQQRFPLPWNQQLPTFKPFSSSPLSFPSAASASVAPIVLSKQYASATTTASTTTAATDSTLTNPATNSLLARFNPDRPKFSDLFAPKLKILKPLISSAKIKPLKKAPHRNNIYTISRNDIDVFLGRIYLPPKTEYWGVYRGRRFIDDIAEREIFRDKSIPSSFDPIVLDDWESKIIWNDDEDEEDFNDNIVDSEDGEIGAIAKDDTRKSEDIKQQQQQPMLLIRNSALDADTWTDAIIWDDEDNFVPPPIAFYDPTIVNDLKDWADDDLPKVPQPISIASQGLDRFNLSNDMYYANTKRDQHVRQTQGTVVLRHAKSAIEMMWPHYKTQLNTQELRNFHRPAIKFMPGEVATFSKVKGSRKKKDGVEPCDDFMNLSLKDSSNFVLLEYSEEYPPILSNFGMGTLIQNFYRKENEKDMTVPKFDVGHHSPLEKIDASPFNNFGDVTPGNVIQGITNNLIRAPIFRHEVSSTDFFLVRHSYNGKTRYYIRDIPCLFVVGQTYPQQEVPRPQSRKVLNLMKARLHSIAYRLILNNPNQRLWYPKLAKHFIGQSDLIVRQRLREVAQNWKKGENTGWYKVKQSKSLPTEEELQKIITPEWCCLLETAFAGEQRLKDIGYANLDLTGNGDDGEEQEESSMDVEIQMAPWISTKYFVMTIQ